MNETTIEFLANFLVLNKDTTVDGRYHVDYLDELLSSRQYELEMLISNRDNFIDRLHKDHNFYVKECQSISQQISELKYIRYTLIKELGENGVPTKMDVLNKHIDTLETRFTRYSKELELFNKPGYIEEQYNNELNNVKESIEYCLNHKQQQAMVEQELYLIRKIFKRNFSEVFEK